MNEERFRELARQAGVLIDWGEDIKVGRWGIGGKYENMQKFAQLIVLKCADIINHRADTCSDWLDSVKANEAVREGQRECAKTIKEHFGVEE